MLQSSPEMPVRAWRPHIPPTQLQAASLGMAPPPQPGVPPQFNNGHSVDQSMNSSRFTETGTSNPNTSRNFSSAADVTASGGPDVLALQDPSSSSSAVSIQDMVTQSLSSISTSNAGQSDFQNSNNNVSSSSTDADGFKIHPPQHGKGGFSQNNDNNQRGGDSQKGDEWTHRRHGFHGRNHPFGPEKSFSSSKVKQIYVAKPTLVAKSAAHEDHSLRFSIHE